MDTPQFKGPKYQPVDKALFETNRHIEEVKTSSKKSEVRDQQTSPLKDDEV